MEFVELTLTSQYYKKCIYTFCSNDLYGPVLHVVNQHDYLVKNDILDNKADEISFQDPIYAYWLKTEYFAK